MFYRSSAKHQANVLLRECLVVVVLVLDLPKTEYHDANAVDCFITSTSAASGNSLLRHTCQAVVIEIVYDRVSNSCILNFIGAGPEEFLDLLVRTLLMSCP